MHDLLNFQFFRFVLVGCLNTGFSYAIYAALLYLGLEYVAANFGALLLGILFSFRTQGSLVFRNKNSSLIYRFASSWGLIFLLNISLIYMFMQTGLNAYWAGALALVPTTVISYFVQKFFVFGASESNNATNPTR